MRDWKSKAWPIIAGLAVPLVWVAIFRLVAVDRDAVLYGVLPTIPGGFFLWAFIERKMAGQTAFGNGIMLLTIGLTAVIPLVVLLWALAPQVSTSVSGAGGTTGAGGGTNRPPTPSALTEADLLSALNLTGADVVPMKEFDVQVRGGESPTWQFVGSLIPGATVELKVSKNFATKSQPAFLVSAVDVGEALSEQELLAQSRQKSGWTHVSAWQSPEVRRLHQLKPELLFAQCLGDFEQAVHVLYLRAWQGEAFGQSYLEPELVWGQWMVLLKGGSPVSLTFPDNLAWEQVWIIPVYGSNSQDILAKMPGGGSPYNFRIQSEPATPLKKPRNYSLQEKPDLQGKKLVMRSNVPAGMAEDAGVLIGISAKK